MKARDDAHVGGAVVFVDDLCRVMLRLEMNRLIAVAAEACVDPRRKCAHARFEVLIFLERGARRRGKLHEHKPPDELRVKLEQALDREKALEYALGVIHPVDAEAEQDIVG